MRRIFLDGLGHQIGLARDSDYSYPKAGFEDEAGGVVRTVNYERPEPWWFEEEGTMFLRLNFGERRAEIPGKTALIRVGTEADLMACLEALYLLAERGDLDDIIEGMVMYVPGG